MKSINSASVNYNMLKLVGNVAPTSKVVSAKSPAGLRQKTDRRHRDACKIVTTTKDSSGKKGAKPLVKKLIMSPTGRKEKSSAVSKANSPKAVKKRSAINSKR